MTEFKTKGIQMRHYLYIIGLMKLSTSVAISVILIT